ncbi:MAG: hypothetical protein KDB46_13730 [Solirubrobacterales bacterium]|nr:hypothetical protein [Solirubrobacterales bacterium]
MDLFMAICQGLGLALAVGVGGPLAALFIAAMAALGSGIHPDGTDYRFLAETWFLVTLLAIVVVFMFARGRDAMRGPSIAVLAAIGAIVAAASLAEEGEPTLVGIVVGAIAAAFAADLSMSVLAGALHRAEGNEPGSKEADAANFMIVAFAAAGIVLAAISLFVPPVSLLALVALIWLALSRRRRAGEKYEGLRILR